jgi:hypothetical protein
MKGKFRAIWRVSFALVLALSVGLVMAPLGEVGAATQEFTICGTFNFTVPAGVSQITVQAWGSGGAGGGSNPLVDCAGTGGGGGGGGAYASSNWSVTPGQTLKVVVGAGGTGVCGANGTAGGPSFVGPDTNPVNAYVRAAGGSGGTGNTVGGSPPGGAGGTIPASNGTIRYPGTDGGAGASGALIWSGAGGAGAGPSGGSGGAGIDGAANSNGNPGNPLGGGGGGGRTSGDTGTCRLGGAGAAGKVVITYVASVMYYLTVSSTACGNVTTPGEGTFPYVAGTVVNLTATADAGSLFGCWTASNGTFANPNAAVTTFTMLAQNVTVTANFICTPTFPPQLPPCCYTYGLMISSTTGGNVTTPGEGTFPYGAGTVVNLVASLDAGYKFINWTGNVTTIANVTAATTTITMNDWYIITANFGTGQTPGVQYQLIISSTTGGNVTTPGQGTFTYDAGKVVNLVAAPATGYKFVNWTGNVTTIANVNAASTTITMNGNYGITANFEVAPPSVTTQAASAVNTTSVTPNMNYTVGNSSQVQVCFAYKKSSDSAWSSTDWVSKAADGTYAAPLTGLTSSTQYSFKAQLKYNGTVIEGTTLQFTTATPTSTGWCFIATAAYGTSTAEQIDVLREFRDVVLLESAAGSQFVALYYRLSPPIADFIARSDLLRTVVRELLVDPVVWVVEATGAMWRN